MIWKGKLNNCKKPYNKQRKINNNWPKNYKDLKVLKFLKIDPTVENKFIKRIFFSNKNQKKFP